jgi:hypothetical protein
MPDGTGLIRLDKEGTLSPLIPFNHNLTAENGYTIYDSAPFYTNNGTKVDLNTIDFSSQITIDPSANVTLPAKPMISASASSDVSSLPPSPSQIEIIEAPPSTQTAPQTTTAPSLPPPQNNLEILAAQDPAFANFKQIADDCMDRITYGNVTITTQQCELSLQQGADRWCGFEQYHQQKCEFASTVTKAFKNFNRDIAGILGEGADVPPLAELFPELMPELPPLS